MKARSVVWIIAGAIVSLAVAAAAVAYVSLGPSSVLVYARADQHGAIVAAIARSRAHFWSGCPREDFLPTTPIGAITAAMDGGSREREQSLLALARTLIAKGCGVDDYSQSGTTPLMDAVIFGDPGAARMLLGLGADRSLRKRPAAGRGPSPIDGMSASEMAAFLLDRPAGPRGDRKAVLEALKAGTR